MPKEKKPGRARPSGFKFVVTVGVLFLVFFVSFHLVRLQVELAEKKAVLAKLEEQKQELMISNAEKKEMIENSDQNEFIERIAREYFDFAYPDEQIYIDISGS